MKDLNWNERFVPRNMADEDDFSVDSISLSVQNKLENEKGQITMTKKRIRPLMIAAAAVATAAISMISVNAATDGAITDAVENTISKVSLFINGEEVDADVYYVESGVDEDGNEYKVYSVDVDEDTDTSITLTVDDDITSESDDQTIIMYTSGDIYETDGNYVFDGENVEEDSSENTDCSEAE